MNATGEAETDKVVEAEFENDEVSSAGNSEETGEPST